jgi:predicted peroxiredoxin
MGDDLYYPMERRRMGTAVIINNLASEQPPTRHDVENMGAVLKDIGFDVEVHVNLTSQGMNIVKRKMTEKSKHNDANCFLLLIISHGTADNFIVDTEGNKTWNIESLVTEVCDVQSLVGKPKLFFIEACRGKENNFSTQQMMTKSSPPPQQSGISLPSKQDVFVGFATVPGFVSFTSSKGSPYLQALSSLLTSHHASTDLSDIHLLVKRKLAGMKLGADGARQGAEERSSLLSKLLFSKYSGGHSGRIQADSETSLLSRFTSLTPFKPGNQNSSESQSISIPIKLTNSLQSDISNLSPLSSAEARSRYFSTLSSPSPTSSSYVANTETTNTRPTSLIFSSGVGKPPRSAMLGSPMSSSYSPSESSSNQDSPNNQKPSITLEMTPTPPIFTTQAATKTHVVEIQSSDVEEGLKDLLKKVSEVYGGEGKVKTKKNKKKETTYSFRYIGPEKGALLLEKALNSVKELKSKSDLWKFTQRFEISVI